MSHLSLGLHLLPGAYIMEVLPPINGPSAPFPPSGLQDRDEGDNRSLDCEVVAENNTRKYSLYWVSDSFLSDRIGRIRVPSSGVEKCERVYVVCLLPYTHYLSQTSPFQTLSGDSCILRACPIRKVRFANATSILRTSHAATERKKLSHDSHQLLATCVHVLASGRTPKIS